MSSISVNFCWNYAPFERQTLTNMQFSALFFYMLWHIDLKFCIWLCFTILQIKFECHQFASIFVGVMPLLELRICSFPHFSPTCFGILSCNFAYCFTILQIKFECHQFASIFVGVMHCWSYAPFELQTLTNMQFSALFFYMLWHIELKFCIWLCFTILQIKFECHQFASIFICPSSDGTYYGMVMSVRPSVTVFRTFLLHALTYWSEILCITLFLCT